MSNNRFNPLVQQSVKGVSAYRGTLNPFDTARLLDDALTDLKRPGFDLFLRGPETGLNYLPYRDSSETKTLPWKLVGLFSSTSIMPVSYRVVRGASNHCLEHYHLVVSIDALGAVAWWLIYFKSDDVSYELTPTKLLKLTVAQFAGVMNPEEDGLFQASRVYNDYYQALKRRVMGFHEHLMQFTLAMGRVELQLENVKRMARKD